ncbi:hypothetical protein MK489_12295 [Myxococcota bacterium]|nr:hypothetical protein [Myxococcota bacterium]
MRSPSITLAIAIAASTVACDSPEPNRVIGSDASGLVFVRQHEGRRDLYRARLTDGTVVPFLQNRSGDESWPYWSETARRLVYQITDNENRSRLFTWMPGDDSPTALIPESKRDERWPAWSPDGSRLVFSGRGQPGPPGLFVHSTHDGKTRRVAQSRRADVFFRPSYDPSGKWIVAQRRGGPQRISTLWMIPESGGPQALTQPPNFDQKPAFDRNGTRIYFSRSGPDGTRTLWVTSMDGQAQVWLGGHIDADEHSPHPSPTRDEFTFVSNRDGSRDIFLAADDGSHTRNLTNSPERDEYAPRWSPDGEYVVATSSLTSSKAGIDGERLEPESIELVVIDRKGRVMMRTPGMMADWMAAF